MAQEKQKQDLPKEKLQSLDRLFGEFGKGQLPSASLKILYEHKYKVIMDNDRDYLKLKEGISYSKETIEAFFTEENLKKIIQGGNVFTDDQLKELERLKNNKINEEDSLSFATINDQILIPIHGYYEAKLAYEETKTKDTAGQLFKKFLSLWQVYFRLFTNQALISFIIQYIDMGPLTFFEEFNKKMANQFAYIQGEIQILPNMSSIPNLHMELKETLTNSLIDCEFVFKECKELLERAKEQLLKSKNLLEEAQRTGLTWWENLYKGEKRFWFYLSCAIAIAILGGATLGAGFIGGGAVFFAGGFAGGLVVAACFVGAYSYFETRKFKAETHFKLEQIEDKIRYLTSYLNLRCEVELGREVGKIIPFAKKEIDSHYSKVKEMFSENPVQGNTNTSENSAQDWIQQKKFQKARNKNLANTLINTGYSSADTVYKDLTNSAYVLLSNKNFNVEDLTQINDALEKLPPKNRP